MSEDQGETFSLQGLGRSRSLAFWGRWSISWFLDVWILERGIQDRKPSK